MGGGKCVTTTFSTNITHIHRSATPLIRVTLAARDRGTTKELYPLASSWPSHVRVSVHMCFERGITCPPDHQYNPDNWNRLDASLANFRSVVWTCENHVQQLLRAYRSAFLVTYRAQVRFFSMSVAISAISTGAPSNASASDPCLSFR